MVNVPNMNVHTHDQFEYVAVNESNVQELQKINRVIFPINYPEKVYRDILACGSVSQLICLNGGVIGGIACRFENTEQGPIMYIITLGLLAPYREMGLGSALLTRSLQEVHQLPEITKVVLHVQQGNDRAVKFYQKFGFKVVDVIENYYMKIQPRSAVLLELALPAEEHCIHGDGT